MGVSARVRVDAHGNRQLLTVWRVIVGPLSVLAGVGCSQASDVEFDDAIESNAQVDGANFENTPELATQASEVRIAGDTVASNSISPWTGRPTVFSQTVAGLTAGSFNPAQEAVPARDVDYYPAVLASAKGSGDAIYSGVWHKDRSVTTWWWDRRIAEADFAGRWQARADEGYEFFDFDVHLEGSSTYYDGVWIKRSGQPGWASRRDMSSATLTQRMTEYRNSGYRPKHIKRYGSDRYLGLWVNDGLTDFQFAVDRTMSSFDSVHSGHDSNGLVLTSVSAYNSGGSIRYSGVWVRNSEVRGDYYDIDMTASEFQAKNADYIAQNRVLVDLDMFYDASGTAKYAAVWHRTARANTLESTLSTTSTAANAVRTPIDDFEEDDTNVGSDGRFGLFVQNLETGAWVGYNMNEPFYMASTTKALIAAKIIDDEQSDWDPTTLRSQDWRGEDSRGFVLADFDGGTQTLDTFLTNMLSESDSASTDRLWGLIEAEEAGGLRSYLRDNLGLQNVGEITTICELDRRVDRATNPLNSNLSCDTFEGRLRADGSYNVSTAEQTALALVDTTPGDTQFEPYYATLANSITPVEYGRALRDLAIGGELSATEHERFFRLTDIATDDGYDADQGTLYDKVSTKSGGKHKAKAQVGVMYDWGGSSGDYSDIVPKFTFAVFAEAFSDSDHDPEPEMRDAVEAAIRMVQ